MHANVDARAAATVLFLDKRGRGDQPITAQHPTAGMVDVAQSAGGDLAFHCLRVALEAEMLCGHQQLAGLVARLDHFTDFIRRRRQWLFADDVFPRL